MKIRCSGSDLPHCFRSTSNGAIRARSSGRRCSAPRLRASPRAPSSWPFTARIAARTAMAPGGPEPVARTLRNTASATCYFVPLKEKPSLLTRMDLPMSSLSEDKGAGYGNTLGKEIKTVRGCRNDTGPIWENVSRQILARIIYHGVARETVFW